MYNFGGRVKNGGHNSFDTGNFIARMNLCLF